MRTVMRSRLLGLVSLLLLCGAPRVFADESYAPEAAEALKRTRDLKGTARAAELEKAVAILEREMAHGSVPAEGHEMLGRALSWRAQLKGVPPAEQKELSDRAISELTLAANLEPHNKELWEQLAREQERVGYSLDASVTYHSMAILWPDDNRAYTQRIYLLLEMGKSEQALDAARQWVQLQPENAEAAETLGVMLAANGKTEEAIASYRRSIDLDSTNDDPKLALGRLLGRLERWKETEEAFSKVEGRDYKFGWYGQGLARAKLGDLKAARRWYAKLMENDERGLGVRLLAVIKDPKIVPLLSYKAYELPGHEDDPR